MGHSPDSNYASSLSCLDVFTINRTTCRSNETSPEVLISDPGGGIIHVVRYGSIACRGKDRFGFQHGVEVGARAPQDWRSRVRSLRALSQFSENSLGVLFSPRGFFRDIAFRRGFVNPLIFAVACSLIGAVLAGVFGELARGVAGLEWLASQAGFLSTVLSTFAYSLIGLVISTGVYHLLVMLLARRNSAGLEGTFRVVSYAYAVQV